ncbi:MAG: hypothetical protein ABI645_14765 [Pseudomonadota bacterium]
MKGDLEGIEHGNQFVQDLAIQTKCHTSKLELQDHRPGRQGCSDTLGQHGVVFLDHQSDNTCRDNVAAGSDSTGFWLAFPEHQMGQFVARA